jgi:hypothetical protein
MQTSTDTLIYRNGVKKVCWIQPNTPKKSRIIRSAKNRKKNNKTLRVNRMNCQTNNRTMITTRKIAHKGIERDRNSIDHQRKETTEPF